MDAKAYHHITVFFTNGQTAQFHDVTDLTEFTKFISFYYVSASDEMTNRIEVYLERVAAIAYAR